MNSWPWKGWLFPRVSLGVGICSSKQLVLWFFFSQDSKKVKKVLKKGKARQCHGGQGGDRDPAQGPSQIESPRKERTGGSLLSSTEASPDLLCGLRQLQAVVFWGRCWSGGQGWAGLIL